MSGWGRFGAALSSAVETAAYGLQGKLAWGWEGQGNGEVKRRAASHLREGVS